MGEYTRFGGGGGRIPCLPPSGSVALKIMVFIALVMLFTTDAATLCNGLDTLLLTIWASTQDLVQITYEP